MITTKSKSYEEQVKLFTEHIKEAAAIVVGAASGMSAAAGYRHYYERDKDFVENLGDFEKNMATTIPLMGSIITTVPARNGGHSLPGTCA